MAEIAAAPLYRCRRGIFAIVGVAAVLAVLLAGPAAPMSTSADRTAAVDLTGSDHSPSMGDGVALVMGGSGFPLPPQRYADAADMLYLQPHGFTGTTQLLFTPELFYPGNVSEAQGASILAQAIESQIAGGHVNASNPVVAFGYSQSAAMSAWTMDQLHTDGVPADYVHFVLVGNTANPNGGLLESLNLIPGSNIYIPILEETLGHPTPDLYPTDVYTLEYDGWADFPRYPLNLLSLANALVGCFTQHLKYLGLSPQQIANAIPLETTGDDTLTHYFMIESDTLPLLDPLRLIPIWGTPLADLLEPDLRILVNLGYGSITDGWNQGPANVATPVDLAHVLPPDLNWGELITALFNGAVQGSQKALLDFLNPATYFGSLWDSPVMSELLMAAYRVGFINTPPPSAAVDASTVFADASSLSSIDDSWFDHLLQPIADAAGLESLLAV